MRRRGVRRWAVAGIVSFTACGASDQTAQFQPVATTNPLLATSGSQTTTTSGPTTTTESIDQAALDATWELSGEWMILEPHEIDTAAVHGFAHMNVAPDDSRHMAVSHDSCSWFSGDFVVENGSTTVVPIEGADTGAVQCPRVDKSLTFENTVECLQSGCRFAFDGAVLRLSDIDGVRVADLVRASIDTSPPDGAVTTTSTSVASQAFTEPAWDDCDAALVNLTEANELVRDLPMMVAKLVGSDGAWGCERHYEVKTGSIQVTLLTGQDGPGPTGGVDEYRIDTADGVLYVDATGTDDLPLSQFGYITTPHANMRVAVHGAFDVPVEPIALRYLGLLGALPRPFDVT